MYLRKRPSGDGVYHAIMDGRKRIGHIGGFERDGYLDATNVFIEESYRHQGLFQRYAQEVANQYSKGLRSAKYQTSRAFFQAMRKMPTYAQDERYYYVQPAPLFNTKKKDV